MSDLARDIFGERADRYAGLNFLSEESYYQPLVELADVSPGDRVLDLAAGTGLLSIMLSRAAASVVACDVTPEMLEIAAANIDQAGRDNITLVEADATHLPFDDDSFQVAACRLAFHHFPEPERTLSELRRVLVPGGRFVLEDVFGPEDSELADLRHRFELLLDRSHVRSYSPSDLRRLFESAGFEVESLEQQEGKDMTLDMLLDLERLDTEERRREALELLRANLGRDLGGVVPRETEEGLMLEWHVLQLAAVSPHV